MRNDVFLVWVLKWACFLLARTRGNGVLMPNVAENTVLRVQKTFKNHEFEVTNDNIHETGREKTFSASD